MFENNTQVLPLCSFHEQAEVRREFTITVGKEMSFSNAQ